MSFIKKNKIKVDNTFYLFVNLGPGNLISIRNSNCFCKNDIHVFWLQTIRFFKLSVQKLNNIKINKVLLTLGYKNLLLDLSKKSK